LSPYPFREIEIFKLLKVAEPCDYTLNSSVLLPQGTAREPGESNGIEPAEKHKTLSERVGRKVWITVPRSTGFRLNSIRSYGNKPQVW
jgi:hypothetical protein